MVDGPGTSSRVLVGVAAVVVVIAAAYAPPGSVAATGASGAAQAPRAGFNIALAALGGTVHDVTSERDPDDWAATNLIDGLTFYGRGLGCRPSCGWSAEDATFPQDLVFSFAGEQTASVTALALDTATQETLDGRAGIPDELEIEVSGGGAGEGFRRVLSARLEDRGEEQWVVLPVPVAARHVRLRILGTHNGARPQLAEVKIIEAATSASILAGVERNLADPALGGTVIWGSSEYGRGYLAALLDPSQADGWTSGRARRVGRGIEPEEIVIAFHRDREALLDRIVFEQADRSPSFRASRVAVLVSTDSPVHGFREVAHLTLADDDGAQPFELGVRARFVKLRLLDNYGGHRVSMGTVRLIEGGVADPESVLLESPGVGAHPTAADGTSDLAAGSSDGAEIGAGMTLVSADLVESEPNDSPAAADGIPLGQILGGDIDAGSDADYFSLAVEPGNVLNVEMEGLPDLGLTVDLIGADGTPLSTVAPRAARGQRLMTTWQVEDRTDLLLRLSRPASSVVVVFDTSGSMEGRTDDLEAAVAAFVDGIGSSEQMNLIRFADGEPEVLLPEFSGDPAALAAAVIGKFVAEGDTPLRDSIARGLEILQEQPGSRALVVMTDGADAGSELDTVAFWNRVRETDTRVHTIGLGWGLKARIPDSTTTGERFLAHVAGATGGTYSFAPTSDRLTELFGRISESLRSSTEYRLRPTAGSDTGQLQVFRPEQAASPIPPGARVEFVLDASGSMRRDVEGERMIDVAKRVLGETLEQLPDDLEVGVRVYGHRIREGTAGDCEDSELLVPFAPLDQSAVLAAIDPVAALGTTPLAYSLRQAAEDLGSGDGLAILILLTDGKEECGGDPVGVARELVAARSELRLNIVGFAMGDDEGREQMRMAAAAAHGGFFEASGAGALRDAVERSLAFPFVVLDAAGTEVVRGVVGHGNVTLPEGSYRVRVETAGEPVVIEDVIVRPGETTRIEVGGDG